MDLDGKAAIVTGGGTGVGAATAARLARAGCQVLVNYSRSKDGAEAVGEAIRSGVEALGIDHPSSEARCVTVSIGVALATNPDELALGYAHFLNRADEALYAAKRGGRNQLRFHTP